MDTVFSESSYAHAATREVELRLSRHGQTLLAAPEIPSLRRERKLGYDLRIDATSVAVCLQFKTGEFISRTHSGSITWPLARRPHYRMQFPAGHHQLGLLQELEQSFVTSGTRAIVRYLAPAFWEKRDLSLHYSAKTILANSYGCRAISVPADGLEHFLVRVPEAGGNPRKTIMMSEPVELPEQIVAESIEEFAIQAARSRENNVSFGEPSQSVERVFEVLAPKAREVGFDVAELVRAERDNFEGRSDLARAVVSLTLGEALGVPIGFTAFTRP